MDYPIVPCSKPRMTKSDKWNKRPATEKYWAFKRDVKRYDVIIPIDGSAEITFVLPMPKSWPNSRKEKMDGKPHLQIPDLDNLIKGLGDAIYDNDSHIWCLKAKKLWGREGKIIVGDNVAGRTHQVIRERHSAGDSVEDLAKDYGMTEDEIKEIIR